MMRTWECMYHSFIFVLILCARLNIIKVVGVNCVANRTLR